MSPADMRGSSDENGSWNMICICRRWGRNSDLFNFVMSLPERRIMPAVGSMSRNTVRPTVDLPQPDSPTNPSVSPASIVKLTPSTANTVPPARCSSPLRTGKCFLRSRTSSTVSGMAFPVKFARAPAGGPMAGAFFLVSGILRAATVLGVRAARRKHATGRKIAERWHRARNFLQLLDRAGIFAAHRGQPRDRAHETVRIGMLRMREQFLNRRLLHFATGIHHDDALRGFGHHAEIVGDQDHRRAKLALQIEDNLEDLRLDGDVERGRRLVGNQHLRVAGERHCDHRALAHAAGKL